MEYNTPTDIFRSINPIHPTILKLRALVIFSTAFPSLPYSALKRRIYVQGPPPLLLEWKLLTRTNTSFTLSIAFTRLNSELAIIFCWVTRILFRLSPSPRLAHLKKKKKKAASHLS